MSRAYRGEVRESFGGSYVWRPVTRWFASRGCAERHLETYCEEHGLWLPSQIVRGVERGGATIVQVNEMVPLQSAEQWRDLQAIASGRDA